MRFVAVGLEYILKLLLAEYSTYDILPRPIPVKQPQTGQRHPRTQSAARLWLLTIPPSSVAAERAFFSRWHPMHQKEVTIE